MRFQNLGLIISLIALLSCKPGPVPSELKLSSGSIVRTLSVKNEIRGDSPEITMVVAVAWPYEPMENATKFGIDLDGVAGVLQKHADRASIKRLEIQVRAPSYYSSSLLKDHVLFRSKRSPEGVWGPA